MVGTCGGKCRVRMPQGYVYDDGADSSYLTYIDRAMLSVPVSGVRVEPSGTQRLHEGDGLAFSAEVVPAIADDADVEWSSSDESVVAIDSTGRARALGAGKAEVTASAGGASASCKVTVVRRGLDGSDVAEKRKKERRWGGTYPWVHGVEGNRAKVSWYGSSGSRKHTIYLRKKGAKKWMKLGSKDVKRDAVGTFVLKGLAPGRGYEVRVVQKGYVEHNSRCAFTTLDLTAKAKKATNKHFGAKTTKKAKAKAKKSTKNAKAKRAKKKQSKKTAKKADVFHDGVLVTNKKASYKRMSKLKVQLYGTPCRPYVKYNFSKKNSTLYVHLFVNLSGKGLKQRFTDEKGRKSKLTYERLFKRGVKRAFDLYVVGDRKNFGSSKVRFRTEAVLHVRKKPYSTKAAQSYIDVQIGLNPKKNEEHKCDSWGKIEHWFHAHASGHFNGSSYHWGLKTNANKSISERGITSLHLPTNPLLEKEGNSTESLRGWESCCAHELGHMLGLDDAYDMKKRYDRLTATPETSIAVEMSEPAGIRRENMMTGHREMTQFLPNDVEMMLASYAAAAHAKNPEVVAKLSWQSYKSHKRTFKLVKHNKVVKETVRYTKSNVIH